MDSRKKTEYANKVKCSTLKSAQPNRTGTSESGKLMLGLTNVQDSQCEYEPVSIVPKPRKTRQNEAVKMEQEIWKENPGNSTLFNGTQTPTKVNETVAPTLLKPNENPLSFFDDSEPIEDNSKAFMGSFGSWFNDFFNAVPTAKRPHTAPKVETKPQQPETVFEEDSDYFKSINVLKEQFRKKLKSETSVHVLNGDKLLQFNFAKGNDKRVKKRSKSLPSNGSLAQELFPNEEEPAESEKSGIEVRRQNSNDLLNFFVGHRDKETSVQLYKSKNTVDLNNSNLIREKKKHKRKDRSDYGALEEYVCPVPADLTKRLLLNLDEQEKTSRLYKNSHMGMQENQHHVQKKNKSYQNSARCYTTNASLGESLENSRSKTFASVSVRPNRNSLAISSGKRKVIGEFARDNSTFVKIRSQKSSGNPHPESARIDSKGSSDDLVKYLMKKVKVQHRPQPAKKKNSTVFHAPALISGKAKFMQSATSSLVMNALSKKENDILLPVRNISRIGGEKNDILSGKSSYQSKTTWNAKYDDTQARLDVKRVSTANRLNKSTYLSDDLDPNYLLLDRHNRYAKRFYDPSFKSDAKDVGDRYGRRKERETAASKLDKSSIYKMAKVKSKDSKKKFASNLFENFDGFDGKENSSGKFQHQHELFKNSMKMMQEIVEPEPESTNNNNNSSSSTASDSGENGTEIGKTTPIPAEIAVVDNFQLIPNDYADMIKCETNEGFNPMQNDSKENTEKVLDCFKVDDNSLNLSLDNSKSLDKDKFSKSKSLQYIKEENSRVLLGPPAEPVKMLATSGAMESSPLSGTVDVRQSKSLETTILNRRLSTGDVSKQKNKSLTINHKAFNSTLAEKDGCKDSGQSSKKQAKEKKKEKPKKSGIEESPDCGFEKTKKPGPSCEEGATS